MSMTGDLIEIGAFITACLDHGGGAWEQQGDNLIEALLPADIADLMGGESLTLFALGPDALAAESRAQLATPGSPALDAFIRYASTIGRTSVGGVLPSHYRGKGLREEVSRKVIYRNCRLRSDDAPPKIKDSYYAVFYFTVEYISDERREQVVTCAVDLGTMRPNRLFAERLEHLSIMSESAPSEEWYSGDRLERAFAAARDDLIERVRQHADSMLANARRRFEVESQRLTEYYGQVAAELERRAQKELVESKRAGILDKIAVSRSDGERKIVELSEKYRIRPRATLSSLLLIRQPKTYFDLLVDRGPLTRRVAYVYDSLLDRLELPLCDRCKKEMTSVTASPSGEHLCPDCCA